MTGIRRFVTISLAALGAIAGLATSGIAAQEVQISSHEHKAVNVLDAQNPCTGAPGTLTEVENGVFHLTAAGIDIGDPTNPNDDTPIPPYRSTLTVTNTVQFAPGDPALPTFTGHSQTHINQMVDSFPGIESFENTVILTGSDGSTLKFHEIARATFSASGAIVDLVFDKPRCTT